MRLLLATLLLAVGSSAAPATAEPTVRVLVRLAPGAEREEAKVAGRVQGLVRRQLATTPIVAMELPESAVAKLRRDPGVETVEVDPVYHATRLATSELEPKPDNGLYGLVLTHTVQAQARKVVGKGIRVGIADTGIDARHPDVAAAYRGGFDLVDDDENPDVGADAGLGEHGTMVAGIIAAARNKKGVRGVAYGAEIVHARVLGPDGRGFGSDIMAAVERLIEREGCRIVNLSLGGDVRTQTEETFYRELLARHPEVLVVAASGNDGHEGVSFPAAFEGVVAVGAVGPDSELASFSNVGPELDLVAPGVAVLSSVPRGSGSEAFVQAGRVLGASAMTFAGQTGGLKGPVVDCGTGNTPEEFPAKVRGAIALMRRGDAFFSVKVENAMNAGARAAVIYNNVQEAIQGTLQTETASDGRPWIPAVLVSTADGESLRGRRGAVTVVNAPTDWAAGNGTSFAAPHVAGAAALVLSVRPSLDGAGLLALLEDTAADLGDPGLDPRFGWGLVDVDAATKAAR
jgi:subtilisin family serine protease